LGEDLLDGRARHEAECAPPSGTRQPAAEATIDLANCRSLSTTTHSYGRHVGAQDGVHSRLVTRALLLEPIEHIGIDPKGYGLLRNGMD
jgi:hypothetical protein